MLRIMPSGSWRRDTIHAMKQGPALAMLAAMLATPAAFAQHTGDEAARHYASGRAALLAHHDDEAAREFLAAYELSRDPSLLFNLGVVYEDARRWSDALDAYHRYLAALPAAENRADVERRIHLLEATVQRSQPAEHPVASAAPSATVTVSEAHASAPVAPIVVAAGGAVVLVVGGVFGGVALATRSDLDRGCGGNVTMCTDTPANRSLANNLALDSALSDVFLGVGAVAVIAGGVWFFVARGRSTEHPQHASIVVRPGVFGVEGTF